MVGLSSWCIETTVLAKAATNGLSSCSIEGTVLESTSMMTMTLTLPAAFTFVAVSLRLLENLVICTRSSLTVDSKVHAGEIL